MIEPLYNNVIVEPMELQMTSKGGILIQERETRAFNMQTGRVVAKGKGMITPDGAILPLHVEVGDIVLYIRGTGIPLRYSVNSPNHLLFKETDLFCILREEKSE